ncbi:MAG: gluconokinase [candidate division NC10 bacterium]|nr:gluconokinase [candidate division NC10 bacterium]
MPSVFPPEPDPPAVVALDLGTSSVRALLFDRRGRALPGREGRAAYAMEVTPDGGIEADADAMVARTVACLDALLAAPGPLLPPIAAVATSTFWHSLVGVDGEGRAVTPLYSWGDTRGWREAALLRQRLDEGAVHARTGCPLHVSYLPAKLLWLSRAAPDRFRRAVRWMSVGEYLHLRLLGRTACSLSMASGTGLFDQRGKTWDAELLAALPIGPEHLGPLVDLDAPVGSLGAEFAGRWPVLRGVPWLPALGDGACSNVGSGCTGPGRVALAVGTSGAMRAVREAPAGPVPWGLWAYLLDRRRALVGGALSSGGDVFAWLQETLRLGAQEEIERDLAALPPDGHGLTCLPFLAGERSPGWAARARGALVGLSLGTRPIEILQAALEAIAYRFALIRELLGQILPGSVEVIASGGALLRSPAWMQMMADVLGEPVTASGEPEASSRGAALLALEALGHLRDLAAAPAALGRTFAPEPAKHQRYREALKRHRALYEALVARES